MRPTSSPLVMLQAVSGGDAAPWWGVPVIAGGFLVLGAFLAFVFNLIQDNRRAAREKAQRWDQNVLNHTSAVITLTKRLLSASSDYQAAQRVEIDLMLDQQRRGEKIEFPTIARPALSILSDTFEAFNQACDELALVAPTPVRVAVDEHWEHASSLMQTVSSEESDASRVNLSLSSDSLSATVRDYFGIERLGRR
ncbi:hypothetical protein LOK55_01605 [Microbacterium sp. F2E]|uniref:hypothetical protein n=1 Tax=Microbacterium sp. F2E TaxID=2895284 RepID=UPI001E4AF1E4|nr:hypothetical protein [Microbacterium sp. F2E]MCC9053018.1 hypothetical protein [Microbacterium sp. F2E]